MENKTNNDYDYPYGYGFPIDPRNLSQEQLMAIRDPDAAPLDLEALNARLKTLKLQPDPLVTYDLGSAFPSPHNQADLRPQDSVSMYRAPPSRGGTNVDPEPGDDPGDDVFEPSVASPSPSVQSQERMTMGSTAWTGGHTLARNMYSMRDQLQANNHQKDLAQAEKLASTSHLATTLTKLEYAEAQLRSLQATLIAERVARSQVQRDAEEKIDQVRTYKMELKAAVRALQRAREEGKRTEEDKRRITRAFDEARDRLYKYHEELRVRDARARGREEGRAEAWQEAERWMGNSPPIPVDPVSTVPPAVWRTPQAFNAPPGAQWETQQQQQQPLPPIPQQPTPQPQAQDQWYQEQGQPEQQWHPQSQTTTIVKQPQPQWPTPHPSMPQTQPAQSESQPQQYQSPAPIHPQANSFQSQQPPSHLPSMMQASSARQPSSFIPPPTQQQSQLPGNANQSQYFTPGPTGPLTMPSQPPSIPALPQGQPHPYPLQGIPAPLVPGPAPGQYPVVIPVQPQVIVQPTPATQTMSVRPGDIRSSHQTPRNNNTVPPSQRQTPHSGPSGQAPSMPSRYEPHAADSYLDRVDHDPRLKALLSGAPSKTIRTISDTQVPGSNFDDSAWQGVEKPLPPVASRQPSQSATRPRRHSSQSRLDGNGNFHATHGHHPDGDRYPAFPFVGSVRGHSRQSSLGSIDPASRPLPASTAPSGYHTPAMTAQTAQTPRSRARSRVAGALRNDGELDDLEPIAEEAASLRQEDTRSARGAEVRGSSDRPPLRPRQPPSMPSMRQRPTPVMPAPLGKASTDIGRPTDPHRGHLHQSSLSIPGQAPVEEYEPRHSALGLSGVSDRQDPPTAPTITVQPPSRSSHNRSQQPRSNASYAPRSTSSLPPLLPQASKQGTVPPPKTPTAATPANAEGPTRRQTIIVTEQYDSPQPHEIPLPQSRSKAPTAYTGNSPDLFSPQSQAQSQPTRQAHSLALHPNVSVIDFALNQPLPPSRPVTMVDTSYSKRAATVTTDLDPEDPDRSRRPPSTKPSIMKRKPVPDSRRGTVEPHKVPLPPSRPPTRPRASTYAGTVATIDEVTEEESGRENQASRSGTIRR